MVVRHSWQFGTAVLVTKSNSDLQSVIINPGCSAFKDVSGWDQSKVGSRMYPHMLRIQVSLSSELDIAYASALSVERTTLPICFECQTMGENSVVSLDASFGEYAMINKPCWPTAASQMRSLRHQNLQS